MSSGIAKVRVSQKAVKRVEDGHPWIFSSDVLETGGATPGSAVLVTGPRGQILGTAHYSSTSQIALRLLSPQAVTVDSAFFLRRVSAAQRFRNLVVQDTDAYRLVHAEGDFLPGLIVDNYAGYLVVQFLDQGMDAATPFIVEALTQLCQPRAIVARNDGGVRKHESLPLEKKLLAGELSGPVQIRMNGLSMEADLMGGQKTGVYLESTWTSAKTTQPRRDTSTLKYGCSTASRVRAALLSTWRVPGLKLRPWTVLRRRSERQNETPAPTA